MNAKLNTGLKAKKQTSSQNEAEVREPRKYKVVLINDDYTPMEFVVHILMQFFYLPIEEATRIMFQVHFLGHGICGVFTKEVAETKVILVNQYSRLSGHPLLCTLEAG